jgi:hypothetical protein
MIRLLESHRSLRTGHQVVQAYTYLKAPQMPWTTVRTWLSFGSDFFFDSTHTEVAKDVNFDAVD